MPARQPDAASTAAATSLSIFAAGNLIGIGLLSSLRVHFVGVPCTESFLLDRLLMTTAIRPKLRSSRALLISQK
jgi:hypothetical protein